MNAFAKDIQFKKVGTWSTDFRGADPDICSKYLFEARSVQRWLSTDNAMFISGGRGVGKSMLLILKRHVCEQRHIKDSSPENREGVLFLPYNFYIDSQLRLQEVSWEKSWIGAFFDEESNNKARNIWLVVLSISILTSIGNKDYINELLEKFSNSHDTQTYDFLTHHFFNARGEQLRPNFIIREFLLGNITPNIMSNLITNVRYFTEILSNRVRRSILMFVDATDEIDCTRDKKNIWINIQTGLISAAWSIKTENPHIKIYTAIRQEAWDNYEEAERQNLKGTVCELNYENEIEDMVGHFFQTYEGKSLDTILGFNFLQSPHSCITETPTQYIVRHTLSKPRDIVAVCEKICFSFNDPNIQKQSRKEKIKKFRKIVNEYASSEMLAESFLDYKFFLSYLRGQSELKPLLGLINCNVLDRSEIFAILEQLKRNLKIDEDNDIHPFCDLYKMGFIGGISRTAPDHDEGTQDFLNTFTGYYGRWHDTNALPVKDYYLTHPCLSHLLSNRNGQKYHPLVGIKTGENLTLSDFDMQLVKAQKSICKYRLDAEPCIQKAAESVLSGIRKLYTCDFGDERAKNEIAETARASLKVLYDESKIDEVILKMCNDVISELKQVWVDPGDNQRV